MSNPSDGIDLIDYWVLENGNTPSTDVGTNQPSSNSAIFGEELSYDEQRDRISLERQIERAFYEAGWALRELRNRRLYRSTHKNFEEYCKERFGFTHRHANYLIAGAEVVENLMSGMTTKLLIPGEASTNGFPSQNEIPTNEIPTDASQTSIPLEMVSNYEIILPTTERQVRPLVPFEPEEQRFYWQKAVEAAGGKLPSGRIVKDVVDQIRERTKIPNPYRLGEICILIPKDNPELRGKSGYWGIVTKLGDYSCTIETWDGEYIVSTDYLSSLELSGNDCRLMRKLCMRLRQLHQLPQRDTAVDCLIALLGKQPQPYITEVQEKLLETIEAFYDVTYIH
jgi:hypothetical protein